MIRRAGFDDRWLGRIAENLWYGDPKCPQHREQALRIVEYIVGPEPLKKPGYAGKLAIYLAALRGPDVSEKVNELLAFHWIGTRDGNVQSPEWDDAEWLAFTTRDDVWAFLTDPAKLEWRNPGASRLVVTAYLDPRSSKHDPVKALPFVESSHDFDLKLRTAQSLLDGQQTADIMARAEPLLWSIANYSEPSRNRLISILAPRFGASRGADRGALAEQLLSLGLNDGDAAESARGLLVLEYRPLLAANEAKSRELATKRLQSIAEKTGEAAAGARRALIDLEAKPLQSKDRATAFAAADRLRALVFKYGDAAWAALAPWLEVQLRKNGSERDKALDLLVNLGGWNDPKPRALLAGYLARNGGLVEGGLLNEANGKIDIISPNDYPSRAVREDREGLVTLSLIFGPNGRLFDAVALGSPDPVLAEVVRAAAIRRFRNIKFAGKEGRFVRATMPTVQFRIAGCDQSFPLTPELPGVIVVTAKPMCSPTPEVIQVISASL